MKISHKFVMLGSAAMFAVAISGCGKQEFGTTPTTTSEPTTVNALATTQINEETCTTRTPDDINSLTITDSDDAIDVTTLSPGCSGST